MHSTLRVISFVIPSAVGIALAAYFDQLPERMPVHWNVIGIADQFWPKSIPLVFARILAAFGVLLVLHIYVPMMPKMRYLDPRVLRKALTGLGLSSSLLFSLMAASPLTKILAPDLDLSWIVWFLIALTLTIVVSIVLKVSAMPEPGVGNRIVRQQR